MAPESNRRNHGILPILALVLLGSLEHMEPAPARLVPAADTVVVNGPASFRLPVVAIDARGEPVLPVFVAYDSSVVRYADGLLHPVGIGGSYLDADFSGMKTYQPIQVIRRVVSERPNLAADEIRTWPLPVGRSELFLASDSTSPAAARGAVRAQLVIFEMR